MKKLIFFLAFVLQAAFGCKEKKTADYTRLGTYTPYQDYMEKLHGKVASVTEKAYWAVPEGDSYVKGARITRKELDSIGYTYDFKAVFDPDGDLVSCTRFDDNDNVISTWSLSKENGRLARAEYKSRDTVRYYNLITCDDEGNPVLYEAYNALADTLIQKAEVKGSDINDTVIVQFYGYNGEPVSKWVQIYNDKGLLTRSEFYNRDGTPGESFEFIYNDMGFQSEATLFDKDKNVRSKTFASYEYDEKGNWIKSTSKDSRGFTVFIERVYTYFD